MENPQQRKREWLVKAVQNSGRPIKEIAEAAGMNRTEISGMLHGHRTISDKKLQALEAVLGGTRPVTPSEEPVSIPAQTIARLQDTLPRLIEAHARLMERYEAQARELDLVRQRLSECLRRS